LRAPREGNEGSARVLELPPFELDSAGGTSSVDRYERRGERDRHKEREVLARVGSEHRVDRRRARLSEGAT
jgi:hypothetical protein